MSDSSPAPGEGEEEDTVKTKIQSGAVVLNRSYGGRAKRLGTMPEKHKGSQHSIRRVSSSFCRHHLIAFIVLPCLLVVSRIYCGLMGPRGVGEDNGQEMALSPSHADGAMIGNPF